MSLILRYRFDQPTVFLTTDSSGNANTLTNAGGVVSVSDTTYGSVAYFDGSEISVFTLPNAPSVMAGTSPKTFSFWVKRDNQQVEIVSGQGMNANDEFRVQFQEGFRVYNNGTKFTTGMTSDYVAGIWYHMVLTYDGTTEVIYADGNVVDSLSISSVNTANGEFMIGGSPAYLPNHTFTGAMSDFRVYDSGLSATEVSTLYNEGPNPTTANSAPNIEGNSPRKFNQLRIETSGSYLNFSEVQILDLSGTNIAALGAAGGSGGGHGGPGLGNDGGTDHAFSGDPLVNTVVDMYVSGGPVFWSVDLDRGYTLAEINKVIFYNRSGSVESARAIGCTISFHSADGGAPEQVAVLTSDLIQEFVLSPLPEFFLLTPSVTSISATVVEVPGALAYQITKIVSGSDTMVTTHSGISSGDVIIDSLTPGTTYVLQLYADTGDGYSLRDTGTVTTLANSASNYDTNVFRKNGKFDLSGLDSSSFSLLDSVIDDVFATGDKLEIKLRKRTSDVTFVKVGDAVSTDASIMVPFDGTGGSGQAITMNLSDNSTLSVTYDDINNALEIGPKTVNVGESIIVDGKKLTFEEL